MLGVWRALPRWAAHGRAHSPGEVGLLISFGEVKLPERPLMSYCVLVCQVGGTSFVFLLLLLNTLDLRAFIRSLRLVCSAL